MNLLILGAGGHGKVVKEIAEVDRRYETVAFLDDRYDGNDVEIIGNFSAYMDFREQYSQAFVAMGNLKLRSHWEEKMLLAGYELPSLVHPDACISPSASIDMGTVIMAKAVIQTNAKVGRGCIISAGAVIDHDAEVGDYCHINSGAIVAAGSRVPSGIKVDYNEVFRNSSGSPIADKELQEQHRKDFGTEISFF